MASKHEKYEFAIESLHLTEEEQQFIDSLQEKLFFPKGTIILSEGQIISRSFHVLSGCVRKFYLKDGEEKTSDFFIEHDSTSGVVGEKSKFFLDCIEDTTVNSVSGDQEKILYEKFPRFQSVCRISTEKKLHEYQEKFSTFISSSPEERYLQLLETRPYLLNRVPQYQLASYLGVKPESLSRIRKRLSS